MVKLLRTLIDGKESNCVPSDDRGLGYGDGIFETIAVIEGKMPLWSYHRQRLISSATRLQIHMPDISLIESEIAEVINQGNTGTLKLILTRGSGQRGYGFDQAQPSRRILQLYAKTVLPSGYWHDGIRADWISIKLANQPVLAGIKHLNRLEQVMARTVLDSQFEEGVMCNTDGNVIEAISRNLFIVEAGHLLTPRIETCGVAGVMRQHIIEQSQHWGVRVTIDNLNQERVKKADEIFLCNSIHGIWPVRLLGSTVFPVGRVTHMISQRVQEHLPI